MNSNPSVTVFTPTYNRAYSLPRLFDSLKKQTVSDFEWIVVNDGSTDHTQDLLDTFLSERTSFQLTVIHTKNQGKHRAINLAMDRARGKWFFIVDSDDWLPENSISMILQEELRICDLQHVAVLCGMRYTPSGERVGGNVNFDTVECTPFDFRYRMDIGGDFAEVVRTDILRSFPFPDFPGEKFCPESILFNRIALKYLTHYFPNNIYICDYQPDGLSAKIDRLRMHNWRASLLCYHIQAHCPVPMKVKIISWINFWRFFFCADGTVNLNDYNIPLGGFLLRPLGWMFHLIDTRK